MTYKSMPLLSVAWWRQKLYPDSAVTSPVAMFFGRVAEHVRPDAVVLDIGAGAGERNFYDFKGKCAELIGIDIDPRVVDNPLLDRGIEVDGRTIPLADNSVDIAFSVYVLEHIEDEAGFAAEVTRVLKPGGVVLSLTPNKLHYVALIAGLTPTSFHKWFNTTRGREPYDTFPTFYRLNTRSAQCRTFGGAGLETVSLDMIEFEPKYLTFTTLTYLAGALYERVVNAIPVLAGLRVNIISTFRKPDFPDRPR